MMQSSITSILQEVLDSAKTDTSLRRYDPLPAYDFFTNEYFTGIKYIVKYRYIYKTTNLVNGKIYVGQHTTTDLNDDYIGSGILLWKAIEKHGISNFIVDILEFCNNKIDLNTREIYWISKLNSTNKLIGYNIAKGGYNVDWWNDLSKEEQMYILEKRKTTLINRSEDKKVLNSKKCSINSKNFWNSLSEAEYLDLVNKVKLGWENRSDINKKEFSEKRKMIQKSFTPEKVKEISNKISASAMKLDPEVRSLRSHNATSHLSPEKRSENARRATAHLSPEQRSLNASKAAKVRSELTKKYRDRIEEVMELYYNDNMTIHGISKKLDIHYTVIKGIVEGTYT